MLKIKIWLKKVRNGRSRNKNLLLTFAGLVGLIIGSRILVLSGVEIGEITHVPQMIIGLFALAIGTSMPELVVTLRSAMKKMYGLSIGTVLGSNIFNILTHRYRNTIIICNHTCG